MPVLNSIEQMEIFGKSCYQKPAALQLDVGMKRLGLNHYDMLEAEKKCKTLNLQLILGHLSSADEKHDIKNLKQLDQFNKLSSNFLGTRKSLAATGGTILGKKHANAWKQIYN